MYAGHWVDGADQSKEVVLSTDGMVFTVEGTNEDGSLELVVATNGLGYPLEFDPERAPDVYVDLDPAIAYENAHVGVGFLGDSFPPAGLGSVTR